MRNSYLPIPENEKGYRNGIKTLGIGRIVLIGVILASHFGPSKPAAHYSPLTIRVYFFLLAHVMPPATYPKGSCLKNYYELGDRGVRFFIGMNPYSKCRREISFSIHRTLQKKAFGYGSHAISVLYPARLR